MVDFEVWEEERSLFDSGAARTFGFGDLPGHARTTTSGPRAGGYGQHLSPKTIGMPSLSFPFAQQAQISVYLRGVRVFRWLNGRVLCS